MSDAEKAPEMLTYLYDARDRGEARLQRLETAVLAEQLAVDAFVVMYRDEMRGLVGLERDIALLEARQQDQRSRDAQRVMAPVELQQDERWVRPAREALAEQETDGPLSIAQIREAARRHVQACADAQRQGREDEPVDRIWPDDTRDQRDR